MRELRISTTKWLCIGVVLACGLALLLPAVFNPQAARAATVVVDDFSTFQADVEAYPDPDAPLPNEGSSSVSGPGILGGERDLHVQAIIEPIDPPNRGLFVGVANGRLEASSQTLARGTITAQWDGPDGDPVNLDPTGLGGVDLTGGGTEDAFLFSVTMNYSDASGITTTIYTDAGNYSTHTLSFNSNPEYSDYVVGFHEFAVAAGSGADFTDVGAVTISFDYNGAGGIGPHIDTFQTTQFDSVPPVTTSSLSGTAGLNGWHTSSVEVTLSATDALSDIASTFYRIDEGAWFNYSTPFTVSDQGSHTVEFYSVDADGNTESTKSTSFKIDSVAPTITGSALPAANANGWNNTPVTVSFECTDPASGSGVDSVTPDTTLTDEGANQSVSGTCSDLAGHSDSTTVSGINIDMTAPVFTFSIETADGEPFTPGPDVWTNQDVIFTVNCVEAGSVQSGINAFGFPFSTSLTGEGEDLGVLVGGCADSAGNFATNGNFNGINIDKTAPTAVTGGPYTVDEAGTISLDGSGSSDALSGIASIAWALDGDSQFNDPNPASFTGLDGPAIIPVALQVTDLAGNVGTVNTTVTVTNVAPQILSVTNDGPPGTGSLVNITVDATDPAGLLDPLSYEFDCDNDQAYEVGPQSENTAGCDIGVQEGSLVVNVRVTDGNGGEALGVTVIEVPTELCVSNHTGALRYSDTGCQRHETLVTLTGDSSITFCVSNYTHLVRYLRAGDCSWSETLLTLPDDGPLAVCVSRYTQLMRAVDSIAQCQPHESGHIIGNSTGSSSTPSGNGQRR